MYTEAIVVAGTPTGRYSRESFRTHGVEVQILRGGDTNTGGGSENTGRDRGES